MIDLERVINGMEHCLEIEGDGTCEGCPYDDDCFTENVEFGEPMMRDALALLKAQSEELDRLKLCRHNCKIECLLDEYNKVVAERDALRKAQEPVAPVKRSFTVSGADEYLSTLPITVCGACGGWLPNAAPRAKYCPNCGKAVKWDD